MRIIITDTGLIWNANNPFLEKYSKAILVVCLNGEPATDKYENFITPYEHVSRLGQDNYSFSSEEFQALASVAGKLESELGYHDDIVFLTDNDPRTLYPFYVLKDAKDLNLHLVATSPFSFETEHKAMSRRNLLADLSGLNSLFYYDINDKLVSMKTKQNKDMDLLSFVGEVTNELGTLLPHVLNGIYHMNNYPSFFDFTSLSYVHLKDGYDEIDVRNKTEIAKKIDFSISDGFYTMGEIRFPFYPDKDGYTKEEVERPVARIDGKKICNMLRENRIKLAEANNIIFESEECPSTGPCAGTCAKCEREAAYLMRELLKLPVDKRVYPQFDIPRG